MRGSMSGYDPDPFHREVDDLKLFVWSTNIKI